MLCSPELFFGTDPYSNQRCFWKAKYFKDGQFETKVHSKMSQTERFLA